MSKKQITKKSNTKALINLGRYHKPLKDHCRAEDYTMTHVIKEALKSYFKDRDIEV